MEELAKKAGPASQTGGVKAYPIEGPMKSERYRLIGMSDAERAWRKQWLQDQVLSSQEPKPIPGYYQERLNPIRRFYRWPLETIFRPLIGTFGYKTASNYRWYAGKASMLIGLVYLTHYYFKYNTMDWTTHSGFRVKVSKPAIYPGDPRYPFAETRKPNEYASEGFEKSPF